MADERPRRVDRRRWRDSVVRHLEELAVAGSRLADLSRLADAGSPAQRAFEEFREAGVIDARLCRRLTRAQRGRSAIEHSYLQTPAGDVHRAATLVHESARDFIGPYRRWIEPYLV